MGRGLSEVDLHMSYRLFFFAAVLLMLALPGCHTIFPYEPPGPAEDGAPSRDGRVDTQAPDGKPDDVKKPKVKPQPKDKPKDKAKDKQPKDKQLEGTKPTDGPMPTEASPPMDGG